MTTHDKHIEAAAAAIVNSMGYSSENEPQDWAKAAITAYCESLANAGEDGVIWAMLDVYDNTKPFSSMRAALAVARGMVAHEMRRGSRQGEGPCSLTS